MSKKAFDLSRDSVYVAEPISQLRVIGGLALPENERGDLDTEIDEKHPLYDERLLIALDTPFVRDIAKRGVRTPVEIVKRDDMATVKAGRRRVRGARIENHRRLKEGAKFEDLIKIKCTIIRDNDDATIMSDMVSENELRMDDGILIKIAKAKRMQARGMDTDAIAAAFGQPKSVVDAWFTFDDNATDETKAAAAAGRLNATAAAELAKERDPDAQRALLASLMTLPEKKRTVRNVRAARTGEFAGIVGRRGQKRLLETVQGLKHRGEKAPIYFEGVEDFLRVLTGTDLDKVDKRLLDVIRDMEAA